MRARNTIRLFVVAAAVAFLFAAQTKGGQTASSVPHKPQAPRSVRLYVFDGGVLHNANMARYNLKNEDVTSVNMSVVSFLIVHPKGTLIWDAGAVPDGTWKPTGQPVAVHLSLPDGEQRDVDVTKSLQEQLAATGYSPADITYLALSHYHYDHTANANAFAGATWLVSQIEHDVMLSGKFSGAVQPSTFSALEKSKTIILKTDEYDVFGDGTVIIKSAPGHTEGHQVLYVKLAKTGGVVLSGDLYHYPAERTLGRVPTFDFSPDQTRTSRAAVEAFLKEKGAQLWIQHDLDGNSKRKKSPEFYE